MSTLISTVARFAREEDAPTMVEYGLLVAGIAVVVGMSTKMLGQLCAEIFHDAAIVTILNS